MRLSKVTHEIVCKAWLQNVYLQNIYLQNLNNINTMLTNLSKW